jgi:hypothetical protein
VIVGTVVLLSLPWLGLIALMVVAIVALGALAWAVVYVPYMLSRALSVRWHARSAASPRPATLRVYGYPYAYVASQSVHDPAPRRDVS